MELSILFFASFILIITVFVSSLEPFSIKIEGWTNYLNWLSLFNWLPLFFCVWAFKPYLNSSKSRKVILILLLIGSVPLIISGFLQVFLDIYGPFKIFKGLIIWFQREENQVLPDYSIIEIMQVHGSQYCGLFVWLFCLKEKKDKFFYLHF